MDVQTTAKHHGKFLILVGIRVQPEFLLMNASKRVEKRAEKRVVEKLVELRPSFDHLHQITTCYLFFW